MFNKIFKKYTMDDLLKTLKDKVFIDSKADDILKQVDINYRDLEDRSFLHHVVEKNLTESIKWLISKNIDINAQDKNGNTPLMYAVKSGTVNSVRLLLELKADSNIANYEGRLPIQEAILKDFKNIFYILKNKIKKLDHKDNDKKSLIYDAIDSSSLTLVEDVSELLNNQIDPKIISYSNLYANVDILRYLIRFINLDSCDKEGKNILFYLIEKSSPNIDSLTYLLSKDININHLDKYGNNILISLIKKIIKIEEEGSSEDKKNLKYSLDMIPWLIEEGVNFNHCDNNGENPLMYAIQNNSLQTVKILLEYDVDANYINSKGETALTYAAMKGSSNIDIVSALIRYGARPNIPDENGKTIVEKIIDAELFLKNNKKIKMRDRQKIDPNGNYNLVLKEILFNHQANLNMLNSEGNPLFFECINYENTDMLKMLVKHGADINLNNSDGYNIIYYYMSKNTTFKRTVDQQTYLAILRLLISLGANVNARDSFGGITIHKAILDNDIQTVKILINSGADLNAIDSKGRNLIHNCMWQNKIEMFRLLYSYNTKLINVPDKFGVLPINYAAFLGYSDFVLELINIGSFVNSPSRKATYIIDFLKKFHKNIQPLLDNARNSSDRKKLEILTENMIKEFSIEM